MKTYGAIGNMRLLDIRVMLNDKDTIYEGMVENAPNEIKEKEYYKLEITDKVNLYISNEE